MKPYKIIFAVISLLILQVEGFGVLSASEDEYNKLLSTQRSMTIETWKQLQSHGITKETKLVLEFFYYASSKDAAEKWRRHLLEYEYTVQIKPSGNDKPDGLWLVTGNTQPAEVNKDILLQWVDYMVTAGWEFGCVFDGWGTEIP